jgi:hypothetical protein
LSIENKSMSRAAAILCAIGLPLSLLALVFLPAGGIDWSPWIFIAALSEPSASLHCCWRVNPVIFRARSRFPRC